MDKDRLAEKTVKWRMKLLKQNEGCTVTLEARTSWGGKGKVDILV